jgi:hypothetical protein
MPLLIAMPLDRYDRLMWKVSKFSRVYEIMQNASIEPGLSDDHFVCTTKLVCRLDEAKMLLNLASRVYPNAIPDIARAIDSTSA